MTVAVAAAAVSYCSAATAEVSFQNLTGSSTRQQVLERFPAARPARPICQPGDAEARSADGVTSCDALELQSYSIGDTPFRVTFLFSMTGALTKVLMIYEWSDGPDDQPPNWQEIFSKYETFRNLLVIKYGQPVSGLCTELGSPGSQSFNVCSEWQGSSSANYDTSQGTIEVEGNGVKRDQSAASYPFAYIGITYSLVASQDASRL